jgi:hypothetical protein
MSVHGTDRRTGVCGTDRCYQVSSRHQPACQARLPRLKMTHQRHWLCTAAQRREFISLLGGAAVAWPIYSTRAAGRLCRLLAFSGATRPLSSHHLCRGGRRLSPCSRRRSDRKCSWWCASLTLRCDRSGLASKGFDLLCGQLHYIPKPVNGRIRRQMNLPLQDLTQDRKLNRRRQDP